MVKEFRSGNETQRAFARRHGVKWTTFRNWLYGPRRRRTPGAVAAADFQEIRIAGVKSTADWGAEIALAGGTVVRLQAGADPQWVRAILQPLRQPC